MIIEALPLQGLFKVTPQKLSDERGFFARVFDVESFKNKGLPLDIKQSNLSLNAKKGTLRGLHYQKKPAEEVKLVQCLQGKVFDVAVDIRPNSASYLQWYGTTLCGEEKTALYIPKGFAHGFLTLTDDTLLSYHMGSFYAPECSAGIYYADPTLNIEWPEEVCVISDKDKHLPPIKK